MEHGCLSLHFLGNYRDCTQQEKKSVKFADLTQQWIQQFAGATVYARGHDYYQAANVSRLSYNPDAGLISAEVAGASGDYDVEVKESGEDIRASCNCPYGGYPCKHVVAVLLSFLNHRREYGNAAQQAKSRQAAIEEQLQKLSKQELVAMVMSCAGKYPDFQRELMVRFEPDRKQTLKALLKQVSAAFPSIDSRSYSTSKIAKELNHILQSVESAGEEIRIEVHWAAADSILHELNEYGMDDEVLENVLLTALENLKNILADNEALASRRREVIQELIDYYNWGNSGMGDAVYDTVMDLCSEEGDFQVVIDKLEPRSRENSYIRSLLASLYQMTGNDAAELAVLERELKYGMDYWRLAEHWLRRGSYDKAKTIVEEGIDKGEGRKQELYDFLRQDYEKRGYYAGLSSLLDRKVRCGDLSHNSIRTDPLYLSLREYHRSRSDYSSLRKLLQLCLQRDEIDLDLYREAAETLTGDDWTAFEKELIARLREQQKEQKPRWMVGADRALQTLAEIYAYKEDLDQLFNVVKGAHELLVKYEDRLLSLHPEHYLDAYRTRAESLIAQRGRENYRQAAEYLKKVRGIYRDLQRRPEDWDRYVGAIRDKNKSLRALHEELQTARLIG